MFPSLTTAIILASATLQPAPMPGEYVGERPENPTNERLWQRYDNGILSAMVEDRSEDDPVPEFFVEPMFFDGRHMCGAYHSSTDDERQGGRHIYITRLEHMNFGEADERRAFPVRLITADASEAALDQHCPNAPPAIRAGLLTPDTDARSATPTEQASLDPNFVGMVQGERSRPITQGLQNNLPELSDGTFMLGWYDLLFRQGDLICGEYKLSTPEQREWSPRWLVARIDSFSPVDDTAAALPVSLIHSEASPEEVSTACPGLAQSGDFQTLMTPGGWRQPGKHRVSLLSALTPALLEHFQAQVPENSSISVSYGGAAEVFPENAGRVCGWMPVRMTSDYATQTLQAFIADIDARRVDPSGSDPYPTWDVQITQITLPEGGAEIDDACPSLRREPPHGHGIDISHHVTMTLTEAVEAHRNGEPRCHFWDDDVTPRLPGSWPSDVPRQSPSIPGGVCRSQSHDDYAQYRDRMNERIRERYERMPME